MVLESTLVCLDNSEFMRNGDYAPSRIAAQADAVNLLCGAKTQSNPENTVGLMTLAGKVPKVLIAPTAELGKVLSAVHGIAIEGEQVDFAAGIQKAQLALKHRQNKNQRQRIVLFAGSPIETEQKDLVKIAKKLKKNNVAVDIVSFGETDSNNEKLEAFHAAVNSNDNSHFVTVPPGPALLDALISTPIFQGEDGGGGSGFAAAAAAGAAAAAAGGGGAYDDFGVDPNLDPELALALRVSMEEERARQEAAAAADGGVGGEGGASGEGAAQPVDEDAGEDALLQQALAMSMDADGGDTTTTPAPPVAAAADDEDEELQRALAMSMEDADGDEQK
ncbi:hypothetical protein PPROV_001077800 [Pycnococcus provasolii]|uniref:26S proteasome non-ATPase regulatory subunit 4 homolog n=1 Tax=Pycnococcus provasolii TaxID=41880 RepID=A0A830I2R0_9CHLO|nr:hypothetical protein PPROV_001077800 [Pycnococcus provasolii]